MHRTSTDLEYYRDKKLVIDADGVEVTLPTDSLDSAARAEEAARNAKNDADRAERVVSTTRWSGDKLTVNGKTSPSLTGPKGADGTVSFDALTSEQKAQLKGDPGDVSKTQLDVAIQDVKGQFNRTKPVYFTTEDGSTWSIVGGTPAGWSIWASGRIYPPVGKYWVELSDGATAEIRPEGTGTALKQALLANITDGGYLLATYYKPGHTIKITPIA